MEPIGTLGAMMLFSWLPWAIVSLVGVLFVWLWWSLRRIDHHTQALSYDSVERIETGDGVAIDLRHLQPLSDLDTVLPPVVLVHGIATNHRHLDMQPDLSMARFLAGAGRDVWLLTLRTGRHDRSCYESRLASFSAMVHHDLPAAIDAVRERTGAKRIDYVGYSMGGMLMYAALGWTVEAASIRRLAFVAAPTKVRPPLRILRSLWIGLYRCVPTLFYRTPARLFADLVARFDTPLHAVSYQPGNVARAVVGSLMVNGVEDVPAALGREMTRWALSDGDIRVDGRLALANIEDLGHTVCFMVGPLDRLAPPRSVRYAYDAWGTSLAEVDKRWLSVGLEHGASADYGHADLVMGRDAARDVFRPLAEFLAEHDGQGA